MKDRLRVMDAAEVLHRLSDFGRHVTIWGSLNGAKRRIERREGNPKHLIQAVEFTGLADRIGGRVDGDVIGIAEQWLAHRARLLALGDALLGDRIDWHRDYSSGKIAPVRYSGLINHSDVAKVGNIKYIWELNRLQHLVLLALAWSSTDNGDYGQEIERQIDSWTKENPFMKGVNWKSPLEAGIRLISWAYVSFFTAGVNGEKESYQKALQETIYQHQYFIRKFHSKHSSANNHLIGEMAGLYVGSVFWPWYKESASWRSFARKKLIQEMSRQVEPDGVGKERATEYHMFILEFFLLAGALGQVVGEPFPREYWERLSHMMIFLSAISDRAGNLPMFGDGDSGQVVWLPETTAERARALVRLGQCGGETAGSSSDLRSVLLLWGRQREEVPLERVPGSKQCLEVFPQGGYYVLAADRGGENEMIVVFDAGPLGLSPMYAHGHADALSFWLSYGGHEFLVDPGTFSYMPGVWRSYFRGTAAHNTARVDGEDQSLAGGGPFLWRHVAQCQAERVEENDDFIAVEGFHDGYRILADPVIHRRRMHLYEKSRMLAITDCFECHRTHDIELFFHFSEKCDVRKVAPHSFQISNGNSRLTLRFLDSRLKAELYRGSESPVCGWVSHTFDVKKPSFTLAARVTTTGSTQFLTEITAL